MILSCVNISKSFGTDIVLSNISFHINELEKVAIVGANGAGKSTLLKIIMQESMQDEGEVILSKGATIGYLSQHQELSSENSIYDELLSIKKDIIQLDQKIRRMEQDMSHLSGAKLEQALEQYSSYTHEFEQQNGYAYRSEIIGVLKGLGFAEDDFNKKTNQLSGGQKTRVSLGKLLLSKPDIILLDEPTNHLDIASIAWLENYLLNYNGAVVIVAHDRYFLNKIVSKVVEIEQGTATVFHGNYSDYAKKKAELRTAKLHQYYNQQQQIKHQEEVIAKLRSFNREKSIKRAESREKLLQKMDVMEKPITQDSTMRIHLDPSVISGNDVLTVENISKEFDSLSLFQNLSFSIKRGEKVSIIGDNGTGKTTILKLITGILPLDSGKVTLGSNVKIGYYDQEHQVLDMDKTIFDEIHDDYPKLTQTKIRNTLASFLFTEDDVFKRIKDLSGGERGRVSLAKLMLSEANFLILDEPTNHLDILSKEILEQAINNYTGTVLYVSHDRYFINQTASRILELTHCQLLNYIGNYDYYLEKKEVTYQSSSILTDSVSTVNTTEVSQNKLTWQQQKDEQARVRKIENQIDKTEKEISHLEKRNEEIDALLVQEEVYSDLPHLIKLNNEKQEIELKLENLLMNWEELSSQL
ncbi:MAG: ABC-F type ribosomal protection protein [Lachnospiraceae bacterium]|nr:ABC-F type ribosomal protection protein [Lachnospiraceae bacterium]